MCRPGPGFQILRKDFFPQRETNDFSCHFALLVETFLGGGEGRSIFSLMVQTYKDPGFVWESYFYPHLVQVQVFISCGH